MRSKLTALAAVLSVVLVAGCAKVRGNSTLYPTQKSHEAKNPESVSLFRNAPPVQFVQIGEVSASGNGWADWKAVEDYLKQQAARMGGDAVVLQEVDSPIVGSTNLGNGVTSVSRGKIASGVVIRYVKETNEK